MRWIVYWIKCGHHRFGGDFFEDAIPFDRLVVPGWATDWRLFPKHKTTCYVERLIPDYFYEDLVMFLNRYAQVPVVLLGFSMGGFAVWDAIRKNTALAGVSRVVLMGVRPCYPSDQLDEVLAMVQRGQRAYMGQFYRALFGTPADFLAFKRDLLDDYLDLFSFDMLSQGIAYLRTCVLTLVSVSCPIQFVHGENDVIAPYSEIQLFLSDHSDDLLQSFPGDGHFVKSYFL